MIINDLAEILKVSPESLTGECGLGSIAQWDSVAQIDIMIYLEKNYNIEINESSLDIYSTLKNILALENN